MNTPIKFSIVIPTYNGEKYVTRAIESALNQTRLADEIIVVDDNSDDSTLEICKKFGSRIKIYHNPDGPSGFVNGWKNAIARASGDYISILHQDDLLYPEFLEEVEKAISLHPDVKHFFTPCDKIDAEGNITYRPANYCSGRIHRFSGNEYAEAYERVKGHIHRCPGVVTRRDIFEVCNYRPEAGHIADDDFFLRVGLHTDVIGILKPLAAYREHSNSETGHLSFFKLNRRLLDDYHFQLASTSRNPQLSPFIIRTFKKWESEYIHRLIWYGLKNRKINHIAYGLRKWLNLDNRFGNLRFDLSTLPERFKNFIRNRHIHFLRAKSEKLPTFQPEGKVVIIAPHPDDEVIGCGALIAELTETGNPPHVIILSGGEASLPPDSRLTKDEIKAERRALTTKALGRLGLSPEYVHQLDFIDGKISEHSDSLKDSLRKLINEIAPDVLLVPHQGEGWTDHTCVKNMIKGMTPDSCSIWEYCVWMWYYNVWQGLDWKNAACIRMTPRQYQKKQTALDDYILPLAPNGMPWSGQLPPLFVKAARQDVELYFRVQ